MIDSMNCDVKDVMTIDVFPQVLLCCHLTKYILKNIHLHVQLEINCHSTKSNIADIM